MKKDNKKKKKKKIKVGPIYLSLLDFVSLIILFFVILVYLISPRRYAITTARYGQGSEEDNKNVEIAMGKNHTEERFRLYFQWYNVVHEIGHGVMIYNSDRKVSPAKGEQLANDFAVAYWLYYGEEEKIKMLEDIVTYASENMKNDANGEDYLEYADKHWDDDSFFTFNNYGWFQFTSVKKSLENRKTLDEVLYEMGIKEYKLNGNKLLIYETIDEDTSTQIIDDAIDNINAWGLKMPKAIHHVSDDPNDNYSIPKKKFMGLFEIIDFGKVL